MKIDINEVVNLSVDGVDTKDYPNFCDAFFCEGFLNEKELSDDELDYLGHTYPEILNEMAYQSLI